ncbi:MAG: glycosyltransferase [Acidobacteria bacterium]|nr:glycosyltransferase [Acidobacteriota bacterium]
MRIRMFYHSLISDWNNGHAHFLRGIVTELLSRGYDVRVYEPKLGWSLQNLLSEGGEQALALFREAYPGLQSVQYDLSSFNEDAELEGADLVLVHEWNDPELVKRLGEHRARSRYRLLFHDTHHRAVTDRKAIARFDLSDYDGVLAYGNVIRDIYLGEGWAQNAWTWHEAADTRVFRPHSVHAVEGDLVWIGNWGDEERSAELREFLFEPVKQLRLKARLYGVRYPAEAIRSLSDAAIEYVGWLPNYRVPEVFAQFSVTVHIPRRHYAATLPGIPTIRVFEALACGIPLVSAPWEDIEGLFTPGKDFLVAHTGEQMTRHIRSLLRDAEWARELAAHGLRTVLARHTCAHRVDELLRIVKQLDGDRRSAARLAAAVRGEAA